MVPTRAGRTIEAMTNTTTTQPTSTTDLEAVIDRYVESFGEADAAERTALARATWTDDGQLVDPLIDARGPEAISAAIGDLRAQMPDHSLTRTTTIDAHHDHARFGWSVVAPDGTVAISGIDVVTIADDGRLRTAIGFFGVPDDLG